jgi:ribonuclease Z
MIRITFLGTSSMLPTKERNHSSTLIQYLDEGIMVDCGEGTQRQLRIAKISPCKITKLLITHFHGDHVLGIPGLIQALVKNNYQKELQIYGPIGTKKYINSMMKGIIFRQLGQLKYKITELSSPKTIYKDKNFSLKCGKADHTVPTLTYSLIENDKLKINLQYLKKYKLKTHPLLGDLQRGKDIVYNGKKITVKNATIKKPGKKITIIMDTAPSTNLAKFAQNSDLLICESTWSDHMFHLTKKRKHLTSKQAAQIAKKAKAKKLVLTHFSQRYKSLNELLKEAKTIFKNTELAEDFMKIEI